MGNNLVDPTVLLSNIATLTNHDFMQMAKDNGFTKADFQQEAIKNSIFQRYEFVKVRNVGKYGTVYYMDKESDGCARKLLDVDAQEIVRDEYLRAFNMAPANKVSATIDTLLTGVTDYVDEINNNVVRVAKDMYWDMIEGRLTEVPNSMCMRELFDSRGTHEIKIDINNIGGATIRVYHKKLLSALEATGGVVDPLRDEFIGLGYDIENPVLKTFMTWANGDADTFNDLLKASATNFMQYKPKGAFVLIGLKRNGKSTFIKLLHTLFGRNNTSQVRLSDFSNHNMNGELWTTMMNAPDEEDEGRGRDLLEAQGNFKSIAAHESLKLKVLYEQTGRFVNSDFMCFFPMNHFPEWKGNGAAACMHRTLPLFFNNDLSKYDYSGRDFATDTFTEEFFIQFIPLVLAIASYYHDRPIVFSDKMKHDQKRVEEEVDNISTYLDRFKSWFNGYKGKKLVYADYQLWCREHDLRWQEYSVFSHSLEMRGPKATSLVVGDRRLTVYRLGDRKGGEFFYEDYEVRQLRYKKISELLTTDTEKKRMERSVIAMLDELKDAALNQEALEKAPAQEILDDIKEIGW